jgi:cellulose biosynthesis protein BcsQ
MITCIDQQEDIMRKVIALVGTKGGICKSTLALCLAEQFYNACIIDLDPQGCLWAWYSFRNVNGESGLDPQLHLTVEFYGLEELTLET